MSGRVENTDDNIHLSSPTKCLILLELARTLDLVDFEFEFQLRVRSFINKLNVNSYVSDQSPNTSSMRTTPHSLTCIGEEVSLES